MLLVMKFWNDKLNVSTESYMKIDPDMVFIILTSGKPHLLNDF